MSKFVHIRLLGVGFLKDGLENYLVYFGDDGIRVEFYFKNNSTLAAILKHKDSARMINPFELVRAEIEKALS